MPSSSNPVSPTLSTPLLWALLYGNLVVGMGVMVVPATLTSISEDLGTSIPTTGQLITAGAILMGIGAPLFAALLTKFNRRLLLTLSLAWYALFHLFCALSPNFTTLMVLRVLAVVTPAIFTPQAAAVVGQLANHTERAKFITFIFLGWSISSVFGVPILASIGGTYGWQWSFALVALLGLIGAFWVWREMPQRVDVPKLDAAAWGKVFSNPELMLTVLATVLSAFGQFVLFSYFTAYYKQVLGADVSVVSLLFFCFGAFGLAGNILLSRHIDRIGADRAPLYAMSFMALSLLIWPLCEIVTGGPNGGQLRLEFGLPLMAVLLVIAPWGLGCFSSNSAQQARLATAVPSLAGASVALNTSAIYGGQALGAALGGYLISHAITPVAGMSQLHWWGFGIMLLALLTSAASRKARSGS